MPSEECPRCGAGLRLETRGELLDKVQACIHCDFERDVLDEVTIQQEEAGKRVTIHRKDLGSHDVSSDMLGDADIQAKVKAMTGMDMADLLSNAQSIQTSGKSISRTTTTTQTFSGPEAEQKMAEMGIDIDQMVRNSNAQTPPGTAQAKSGGRVGWILLVLILGTLGTLGWVLNP